MRPVVPEVFRAPTEPTELGGYVFEPGTQLAASILLVQYDPELYPPDPQAFRPERFLDGAPEPYTWVPFGGGVRRCLGAAFAQLEMKVVISTILARAPAASAAGPSEKARFRGVTRAAEPRRRGDRRVAPLEADDGPRTRDLRLGKPTLYQLSYVRAGGQSLRGLGRAVRRPSPGATRSPPLTRSRRDPAAIAADARRRHAAGEAVRRRRAPRARWPRAGAARQAPRSVPWLSRRPPGAVEHGRR